MTRPPVPAATPAAATRRPAERVRIKGVALEQRRQARREALLEAATQVFGERGYHAATVREICARAQLTERYFYESFDGLPALFSAAHARLNRRLLEATDQALAAAPPQPLAMARAGLGVFLALLRDDPAFARIFLIEALTVDAAMARQVSAATQDYEQQLLRVARVFFPDAEQRGLDVGYIASGLIGVNVQLATRWVRGGYREPLETVLANALAFYEAMIRQWGRGAPV
ncbi:MAG TPA: TetR/AcrR family transcriptional regulator [Nevskiaceae bacterium]|nr:TetR/AcrR family transcriptional regulator [Nevskiaceae bacterium]